MITIQLRIATPDNAILAYIKDYTDLSYVIRGDGRIAGCEFTVPIQYYNLFNPNTSDYRVTIWRSINNQVAKLEGYTEFLTSIFVITVDTIKVTAYTLQELLKRRFNFYPANNSTYTKFTSQYTGNVMKALVRNNMTASVASLRDGLDTYTNITNLTVDANTNDGAIITTANSRNNIYDTIIALSNYSIYQGTWLIGMIVSDGSSWQFRTFTSQFGTDRRNQQSLSIDNRNIENIELSYDFSVESNAVIVGGAGTDQNRLIGASLGTTITRSPYARKEYFYTQPQYRKQADVDAAASSLVRNLRPTFGFKCSLLQTPSFVRGIDYDVGDILTVQFLGQTYLTRLDLISIQISNSGMNETAELRLL